jgi:hypothetical protein
VLDSIQYEFWFLFTTQADPEPKLRHSGSGSSQKFRLLAAPAPQHCFKECMTFPQICERKTTKFFAFATKIYDLFLNFRCISLLHRFYALLFFFCKALRQWRQVRKRWSDKMLIMAKN